MCTVATTRGTRAHRAPVSKLFLIHVGLFGTKSMCNAVQFVCTKTFVKDIVVVEIVSVYGISVIRYQSRKILQNIWTICICIPGTGTCRS